MGTLFTILKRSASSFGSDKCSTWAAAIAYNTVFALVPLAFIGIAVLGFVVGNGSATQQVVNAITKVIPLGDQGSQSLAKALQGTSSAKGWLSLIAIVTAAWSASGLFGNIRQSLDAVWDVDRPLPFLRAKWRDFTLMVVFGGLLLASAASAGFLQGARHAGVLDWLLGLAGPAFTVLTIATPLVLTFLAFLYLYKRAPHARLAWADVWIAAGLAAVFFTFGVNLLTFYMVHLGHFNALAGSLGAAILFLVFVYYSSQVILFAAEVSKHRMLVRTDTVPATDPKTAAPSVPLTEKLKGMAERQWVIEEQHHEQDLPYKPSRMDPVTNAPTNTKEEIVYNQALSQEQAQEDAAQADNAPMPRTASPMLSHAQGSDQRSQKLMAQDAPGHDTHTAEEKVPFGYAQHLDPNAVQSADRQPAVAGDSTALSAADRNGHPLPPRAYVTNGPNTPPATGQAPRRSTGTNPTLWRAAGFALAFFAALVLRGKDLMALKGSKPKEKKRKSGGGLLAHLPH